MENNSDTSSNNSDFEEEVNNLLEEQDTIIADLNTKCQIQSAYIDVLNDRINELKNIIISKLPSYLNAVIEFI
jgi:uncharacterized protein YjcR